MYKRQCKDSPRLQAKSSRENNLALHQAQPHIAKLLPIRRTHHATRRAVTPCFFTRSTWDDRKTHIPDSTKSTATHTPPNHGCLLASVPHEAPRARKLTTDTINGTVGTSPLRKNVVVLKRKISFFRINSNTQCTFVKAESCCQYTRARKCSCGCLQKKARMGSTRGRLLKPVSYTHLTLPTKRKV